MKNFRCYQLSMELYKECQGLKMNGVLKNQFERALLSIPLNLSEGSAKPSPKERRKFYYTALGSLREIQTLLKILNLRDKEQLADKLAANLYCLCKKT